MTIRPLVVSFDLDDTLFNTSTYFKEELLKVGAHITGEEGFYTPENTQGKITPLLESADFMKEADIYPAFKELSQWMKWTRTMYPTIQFVVCSHRGFHERGKEYSQIQLSKHNLQFDFEFYICHEKEPCKLDFLNVMFSETVYLHVDDKPSHSATELSERIIIVDKPWNQHYTGAYTRETTDTILPHLTKRIADYYTGV
jgi:hypothetical protein